MPSQSVQEALRALEACLHAAGDVIGALAAEQGHGIAGHLTSAEIVPTVPAAVDDDQLPRKRGPKPGTKRKVKEKDPDAPKRPPTAFLLYSKERRSAFAAENPHLTGRNILTALAEEWRTLPAEKRAPYERDYQSKMNGWRQATVDHNAEKDAAPGVSGAAQPFVAPAVHPPAAGDDASAKKKHKHKHKDKDKDKDKKKKKRKSVESN